VRRRIPAQAFGLKKHRCGTSPVSKKSDKEHATASLGNSEVLSVKHSPREPRPEFCQPSDEGCKVPAFVRVQYAGDVFPYQPLGPIAASQRKIDEGEVAAWIGEPGAQAGDAERLARGAGCENMQDCIGPFLKPGYVPEVRDTGVSVRQHSAGKARVFREKLRAPAKRVPRDGRRFYSACD
jgi:hypothetical protein